MQLSPLRLLQIQQTVVDATGRPRRLFDSDAHRAGADRAADIPRSEAVALMKRARRGRFGIVELAATVLAVAVVVLAINIGGWIGEVVGVVGVVALALGVIPVRFRRNIPRSVVPLMVSSGYCPACLRKLGDADAAGLRTCASCGAVWKHEA